MNRANIKIGGWRCLRGLLLVLLVLAMSTPAFAEPEGYPFSRGTWRFSLQGGSTKAFNSTYTSIGLGVGYFGVDGLELGLDGDAWFGNTPHIYRISPGLRYVLNTA